MPCTTAYTGTYVHSTTYVPLVLSFFRVIFCHCFSHPACRYHGSSCGSFSNSFDPWNGKKGPKVVKCDSLQWKMRQIVNLHLLAVMCRLQFRKMNQKTLKHIMYTGLVQTCTPVVQHKCTSALLQITRPYSASQCNALSGRSLMRSNPLWPLGPGGSITPGKDFRDNSSFEICRCCHSELCETGYEENEKVSPHVIVP